MTLWSAALLGVLQGLTEFLPVSSSGHLALAQMLLPGFHQPGVVFDAMLHVGTAAAVVWFERGHIAEWVGDRNGLRILGLVAAGTVATAAVALPLRQFAVDAFVRPLWVGVALLLTGVVVASTLRFPGGPSDEDRMTWRQALMVGLAQGLAIFPGLSRSGVTIAAGLAGGMDRSWCARFSFLLAVPAVLMVAVFELVGVWQTPFKAPNGFGLACVIGASTAAVTGYFALKLVIKTVSSRVFHRFAWYCIPLGLVVLVWGWLR
jgi:undecaprenyl-diphosphatase